MHSESSISAGCVPGTKSTKIEESPSRAHSLRQDHRAEWRVLDTAERAGALLGTFLCQWCLDSHTSGFTSWTAEPIAISLLFFGTGD